MDVETATYTTERTCCTGTKIVRRVPVATMMKHSIGTHMWVRSDCCGQIHRAERSESPS